MVFLVPKNNFYISVSIWESLSGLNRVSKIIITSIKRWKIINNYSLIKATEMTTVNIIFAFSPIPNNNNIELNNYNYLILKNLVVLLGNILKTLHHT